MFKRIRIICVIIVLLSLISACCEKKSTPLNTTELNTDIVTNTLPELTNQDQNISNAEAESSSSTEIDSKRIYTDKSMTFVWADNDHQSIPDNILD